MAFTTARKRVTKTMKKATAKAKLKTNQPKVATWPMALRILKSHGYTGIKF